MNNSQTASDADSLQYLQTQAIDLFDRCLTQGDTAPIVAFIERHVLTFPPDLELFRALVDALQQRLLSMRIQLYSTREAVVTALRTQFLVDITPLIPPHELYDYHLLQSAAVLAFVNDHTEVIAPDELDRLHLLVAASIRTASQLNVDMLITEGLYEMVLDWFDALCVVAVADPNDQLGKHIH